MPNPAGIPDLVARWRPLSEQEQTNATTFLGDAWRMLVRRLARDGIDLDAAMAEDPDLEQEVVRVLVGAVLRVMKNPDGHVRGQIDDYSWALDESVKSGLLYFSDDELRALSPDASGAGRVFSVSVLAGWDPQ